MRKGILYKVNTLYKTLYKLYQQQLLISNCSKSVGVLYSDGTTDMGRGYRNNPAVLHMEAWQCQSFSFFLQNYTAILIRV